MSKIYFEKRAHPNVHIYMLGSYLPTSHISRFSSPFISYAGLGPSGRFSGNMGIYSFIDTSVWVR